MIKAEEENARVIGFDSLYLKEMEEVKEMHANTPLSPSVFTYVLGAFKGSGKNLGEVAAQARQFEAELNAWMDVVERKEVRR
jgi:hypothetical protein